VVAASATEREREGEREREREREREKERKRERIVISRLHSSVRVQMPYAYKNVFTNIYI
jgi:hypothetical protein